MFITNKIYGRYADGIGTSPAVPNCDVAIPPSPLLTVHHVPLRKTDMSVASQSQNDLQLQAELASAYQKIGDLQGNPANPNFIMLADAIANYEKALTIRTRILDVSPNDDDLRWRTAESHRLLGRVLAETNDYDAEQSHMLAARQILEGLMARDTSDQVALSLAQTNYDTGVGQTSLSAYGKAIPFYDSAIAILEPRNSTEARRLLGTCYAQKAYSLSWESQQEQAEAEMTRAVAALEHLTAETPNDGLTRDAMWLTYWLAGNINEEIDNPKFYRFQEKAARMARDAVTRDASDIRAKQRLAKSLSHLGQAANNIGRPAEALAHLEESSRHYQAIIEAETRNGRLKADLAASLLRLANARNKMGQIAGALETFKQAVAIYVAVNEQFPNDKRTKNNLATAYGEVGKLYEANEKRFPDARRLAGENYRRAFDLMLEMQSQQNILSEYDLEFLEEMRAAVEKFSA